MSCVRTQPQSVQDEVSHDWQHATIFIPPIDAEFEILNVELFLHANLGPLGNQSFIKLYNLIYIY